MERFFDRVHHQRLLARLAQRVGDKPLLTLIGKMLKARVVLPDGVVVSTDEGVPQGGPLSSNFLFGGFFITGPLSVARVSASSSGSLPSRNRLDGKLGAELSEDVA